MSENAERTVLAGGCRRPFRGSTSRLRPPEPREVAKGAIQPLEAEAFQVIDGGWVKSRHWPRAASRPLCATNRPSVGAAGQTLTPFQRKDRRDQRCCSRWDEARISSIARLGA